MSSQTWYPDPTKPYNYPPPSVPDSVTPPPKPLKPPDPSPPLAPEVPTGYAAPQHIGGYATTPRPSEMARETLIFRRDTVVPVLYGEKKIDGYALPVGVVGNKIFICYIFCEGEVETFGDFYIDDEPAGNFSGFYGVTPFTGTLTQTYSTELNSVDANWVEPLTGTAYVVAWFIADDKFSGIPKLSCVIKGRKIYDHRSGSTAYSTNPALCLLDLKQSTRFGAAVADAYIDFTTWDQAAIDCEDGIDSVTNLVLHSEDISDSDWTKYNATATTITLKEDTTTSSHFIKQVVSVSGGCTYNISFKAKAAGRAKLSIHVADNGASPAALSTYFDLDAGTSSGSTANITSMGDGYYRCSCYFTLSDDASILGASFHLRDNDNNTPYSGDGTSGAYFTELQITKGATLQNYIKTTDTAVTVGTDGEDRYSLNYYIQRPASIRQIESYILLHFNGDLIFSEGVYKLNVHKSKAAVASFTQDEVWNVVLGRPSAKEYFNQVKASYTLTDVWQEDEYSIETTALAEGDEIVSTAHFDFTGCASASQVHRLCVFQLNSRASDLRVEFDTYNTQGLERLDRFTFSHDVFSIVDQDFYVLSVSGSRIVATEYTEDLFSDAVIGDPTVPEADLPSPLDAPDAITNLLLSEDVSQAIDTHFTSVIQAAFTESVSNWIKHYEVWVKENLAATYTLYGLITEAPVNIWTTGKNLDVYVKIIAVNRWEQKSSAVTESITIVGKPDLPVWPAGAAVTGVEAGDVAILTWTAAADLDTVRYKIKRGRTTDTWGQSADVATIDALNYFDRGAPAGTWRYFVGAVDSVGGETAPDTNPHVDIEVTINPNLAFNKNQDIELTGSTVNQVVVSPTGTDADHAYPLAANEDSWSERFSGGTAWSDTTDGPWPLAPTSGTIDLVSAVTDMGAIFTGEFSMSYTAVEFGSGAATLTPKLLYSEDGSTYTEVDITSAQTLTARYLKAKFVWTCPSATNFYMVTEPVTINVKANPVVEFGTASVGSGGSLSITFSQTFVSVDKVQLTPHGSSAIMALADSISTSGFTIRTFNDSGAAVSATVGWKVEGV